MHYSKNAIDKINKETLKQLSKRYLLNMSAKEQNALLTVKANRNVIVHNDSKVNPGYLRTVLSSDLEIGDKIEIEAAYLEEAEIAITVFFDRLISALNEKIQEAYQA